MDLEKRKKKEETAQFMIKTWAASLSSVKGGPKKWAKRGIDETRGTKQCAAWAPLYLQDEDQGSQKAHVLYLITCTQQD
eukprot:971947-Pelagomonas_calceolata.AAC.2